jgi:hypothetical protein
MKSRFQGDAAGISCRQIRIDDTGKVAGHLQLSWLVCERLAVFFSPIAILRDGLQRRSTLGSASARSFHLGFGHASTGFRFQTGADVNHLASRRLAWRVGPARIPGLILGAAVRSE